MSFKNLTSPKANANPEQPTPKITKYPVANDPLKNDDPVDLVGDGEDNIKWPPPKAPDGGKPFKLNK